MDGELPGVEHQNIHEHIKCCASCKDEYETLLYTKRMLSTLKVKDPSVALEDRILSRLAEEKLQQKQVTHSVGVWWSLLGHSQRLRWSGAAAILGVSALAFSINLTPVKSNPGSIAGLAPAARTGVDSPSLGVVESNVVQPVSAMAFIHNPAENAPTFVDPRRTFRGASNVTPPVYR